jgi:hypothetical protein
MAGKQIRVGQLIAPFGPGSIYTDRRGVPHLVAGLDFWFMRWDPGLGKMLPCSDRSEFERIEPRLSSLLRVDRFCLPPDYRTISSGSTPPPNADLHVPALRFPTWYRHTKSGLIRKFNLHTGEIPRPGDGGRWQPVRFISTCASGHISEFPWKEWIGCTCESEGEMYLTDRGGSELSSIRIECRSCPQGSSGKRGRDLSGTTAIPDGQNQRLSAFQSAGISCTGEKPWLGEGAKETSCSQPLVAALINQTNIYFPKTLSAISLPDLRPEDPSVAALRLEIEREHGALGAARTIWNMGLQREAAAIFRQALADRGVKADLELVIEALGRVFDKSSFALGPNDRGPKDPELEFLSFRRAEFNILRSEVNDADRVPDLRVVQSPVAEEIASWIARVNLVERLRETRVFYGFDRLQSNSTPMAGMPDSAMEQLFRYPPRGSQECWLPAVEIFGEGIYIELREDKFSKWETENSEWIRERIDDGFIARLASVAQTMPPLGPATRSWAARFLLVHSLAHIVINQLVFECGYSTASLRERLYVSSDSVAPMAAFLIYTAAGDADGTLGGLVRLGRPERLGAVMQRAINRASWCSADPVCSEHLGGQGSKLANLAACHACALLPETACETINQGLDRALVVGTPISRDRGFMAELLGDVAALV